jgi:hypothetical protein
MHKSIHVQGDLGTNHGLKISPPADITGEKIAERGPSGCRVRMQSVLMFGENLEND